MKALPFPCIRPAQDRVLERCRNGQHPERQRCSARSHCRWSDAQGPGCGVLRVRMLGRAGTCDGCRGDLPGWCAGGRRRGCRRYDRRCARNRRPQGTAPSRNACLRSLFRHGIILGAAKEGASLYAVTDPAGITHRVWEVKREDAVGAIRAMLDQAPEPHWPTTLPTLSH